MLKVRYKYADKEFVLQPYSTAQEKDLLLLEAVGDGDLDIALEICGVLPEVSSSLTVNEKKAMLYKLREISVGSDINIKFTCTKCKAANENDMSIENLITAPAIDNHLVTDVFKELTEDTLSEFIEISDVNEMELDEFDETMSIVKDSIHKFEFKRPVVCQKCGFTNKINVEDSAFVISVMSEDSLMSLYQTYNDLTFFGKYTKADIDTMYPFERTIFISLLNKSREDLNK